MLLQSVIRVGMGLKAGKPATLRYMTADPTATMLEPSALATLSLSLPANRIQSRPKCCSKKLLRITTAEEVNCPVSYTRATPHTDCNLLPVGVLKSQTTNGLAAFRAASLAVEWTLHTALPLWAAEMALMTADTTGGDGVLAAGPVGGDGVTAAGVTWLMRAGFPFLGFLSLGRG